MSTIQERLQIKRVPIDKWSIREQLCLASAVARSGDQNWSSVSRSLKPFAEPNRPPDWFSQKNCAAQYGSLLENVETPKRKKRISGQMETIETPSEYILRKLVQERKIELRKKIEEERQEYFKLKEEMNGIKNGTASDGTITNMLQEIESEKKQKEQDALAHAEWLKQREERKMELERVFRTKLPQQTIGQKRKLSETIESIIGVESTSEETTPVIETVKPAPSPLLTSLLKTPSSLPNVSSSILHSAITSQRVTSPTIASLLNSSTPVPVSPSLQQLVTTAISQEPTSNASTPVKTPTKSETSIEDTTLPLDSIIKVEEMEEELGKKQETKEEKEVVVPAVEVKREITNEIAKEEENTKDNTTAEDKEEENDDLESKDDEKSEEKSDEIVIKEEPEEKTPPSDATAPEHDVYYFDESSSKTDNDESAKETTTEASLDSEPESKEETSEDSRKDESSSDLRKTEVSKFLEKKKELQPGSTGSVEIVEVVVEDDDSDKEVNKKVSQIKCDIVRDKSKEKEIIQNTIDQQIFTSQKEIKEEKEEKDSTEDSTGDETAEDDPKPEIKIEKPDPDASSSEKTAMTPEYTEAFFDMTLENTKSVKAKRDYSRVSRKKEKDDKDLEMYHVIEKIVHGTSDENEETNSEHGSQDSDKKSDISNKKLKDNTERSNSPWLEEEEASFIKSKRRYSTPATPIDSVPNSPASSTAYDEDRDYKAWKKSVMLVYSRLAAHKYASLFLKPITEEQAPGYHIRILKPMDLQTIRKNIENGTIKTTWEFYNYVMLMFSNAIAFNNTNEHIYNMAQKMAQEGMQEIQILFQAQAVETPSRRETRTSESGMKRKRVQEDIIRNKKRRDE